MPALSRDQKSTICRLARRAFDRWPGREAFADANDGLSATAIFEAWRRDEQRKAIGFTSLTDPRVTSEDHYLRLVAHFQDWQGQGGKAMHTLLRHAEEPRIVAYHKLQAELAARKLDESYAAAICRAQNKCSLGEATAKQLWRLVFTIRNRRKAVPPTEQFRAPRRVKVHVGTLSAAPGDNPF